MRVDTDRLDCALRASRHLYAIGEQWSVHERRHSGLYATVRTEFMSLENSSLTTEEISLVRIWDLSRWPAQTPESLCKL